MPPKYKYNIVQLDRLYDRAVNYRKNDQQEGVASIALEYLEQFPEMGDTESIENAFSYLFWIVTPGDFYWVRLQKITRYRALDENSLYTRQLNLALAEQLVAYNVDFYANTTSIRPNPYDVEAFVEKYIQNNPPSANELDPDLVRKELNRSMLKAAADDKTTAAQIMQFINDGADVTAKIPPRKYSDENAERFATPITFAIKKNDLGLMTFLIEKYKDVPSGNGLQLLQEAIACPPEFHFLKDVQMIELLLKNGITNAAEYAILYYSNQWQNDPADNLYKFFQLGARPSLHSVEEAVTDICSRMNGSSVSRAAMLLAKSDIETLKSSTIIKNEAGRALNYILECFPGDLSKFRKLVDAAGDQVQLSKPEIDLLRAMVRKKPHALNLAEFLLDTSLLKVNSLYGINSQLPQDTMLFYAILYDAPDIAALFIAHGTDLNMQVSKNESKPDEKTLFDMLYNTDIKFIAALIQKLIEYGDKCADPTNTDAMKQVKLQRCIDNVLEWNQFYYAKLNSNSSLGGVGKPDAAYLAANAWLAKHGAISVNNYLIAKPGL